MSISRVMESATKALVPLGQRMPRGIIRLLGNFVREVELRRWMNANGFALNNPVRRREELFELIGAEIGEKPVLYLEFGVANGDATRFWSKLLKHPDSILHGFDSFEGLPETWEDNRPKGMFSTKGCIPSIDDRRIKFFKGWFEDTLQTYVPPNLTPVVLNLDADLYSSTTLVLKRLRSLIRPGTFLYFDEFSSFGHEERAFREFILETGMKFALRGGTPELIHVLFQCTAL